MQNVYVKRQELSFFSNKDRLDSIISREIKRFLKWVSIKLIISNKKPQGRVTIIISNKNQ